MSTLVTSEKLTSFLANFSLPQNDFQREVYDQLLTLDFPTSKTEYWKYTRLTKIINSKFEKSDDTILDKKSIEDFLPEKNFVVIENGKMNAALSAFNISGLQVEVITAMQNKFPERFGEELDLNHVFSAINSAYFEDIITIHTEKNAIIEEPLNLVFVSTGDQKINFPRVFIHAANSSSLKLTISFISHQAKNTFTNCVMEYFLEENARVNCDKIQNENDSSFHISTEQIKQEKNSYFQINTTTLNGGVVRNNINVAVVGENCETHMNGAMVVKGNTHVDNHTFVDHRVANCFSNENYKYVLDDKSTGVFNGRVVVRQHAQKINAYQKNANILLSDFALMNSKPELEIYADDVKCSHGSTTGQLDEEAVFYLQSRGISKNKAKKLLVAAFIGEVIDQFDSEFLKSKIGEELVKNHGWDKSE